MAKEVGSTEVSVDKKKLVESLHNKVSSLNTTKRNHDEHAILKREVRDLMNNHPEILQEALGLLKDTYN